MSKTIQNHNKNQEFAVGLDIGTAKVCALVAAPEKSPKLLKILGIGISESEGLNRGVVVNIEKTVKTIEKVVAQAEQQSGVKIKDIVVGIAGDHIESFQTRSIIGIANPNKEITQSDVDRLIEETAKISIPADRRILHLIPQDYVIDGQDGITDPVGMNGVRMEANVHVVTGLDTAIQNIYKCVERAGLNVRDIMLEPLASSLSILTDEEKEVGVAIIDIGGGTTDIAIFEENIIRYTSVFGIGGKQVTNDVRQILGIIASQAEKVKKEYGHSYDKSILEDEIFMIPGVGGRQPMEVSKSQLCQVIQPRMEEIFQFALAEIRRSGFANRLGAGIVVTGGTSLLRGTEELASQVFGMPVKIGIPSGITYSGLGPEIESPVFATSVGLTLQALKLIKKDHELVVPEKETEIKQEPKIVFDDEVIQKIKEPLKVELETKIEDKKQNVFGKIKDFFQNL